MWHTCLEFSESHFHQTWHEITELFWEPLQELAPLCIGHMGHMGHSVQPQSHNHCRCQHSHLQTLSH